VIPHKKYFGGSLPYAFTEQGVAMLSSVLNSERAIKVNIEIMQAFVRLRRLLASHTDLARKLEALGPTPVTHVIIGEGSVFSFAERGMIDEIPLARTMV
jgi:DNA repair protein RadC